MHKTLESLLFGRIALEACGIPWIESLSLDESNWSAAEAQAPAPAVLLDMSRKAEKVIIVGAGVAGLSLAIGLAQEATAGIPCQVLEAREGLEDGAANTSGVRVSSQGVQVLKSFLKLEEAIGADTEGIYMNYGSSLSARFVPPPNTDGSPSAIMVTRRALHEQLLQRAKALGIPIVTGFKVASMTESDEGGVVATSEQGETVTGTLLVGADGVGSQLRRLLNPSPGSSKVYAGYLGVGLITRDEAEVPMTKQHCPGQSIGVASIGRVHDAATGKSVFLWTHIHMSEADAKSATDASVKAELAKRVEHWPAELRSKYDLWTQDAEAILSYGPVYNGMPPPVWFSDRMMLMGDAAHPYGPGGQGISMALKDAQALCKVIANGFTDADKRAFQQSRAEESRALGEAAEKRNAQVPPSTEWGLYLQGLFMKAMELFTGGILKF
jgi:2-polyprenyl-6-methoxyphenol hydroxylase-like FAD-dependent oxidoreductase